MVGSFLGMPLSSTHCSVGSLIGLTLAQNHFSTVNKIYPKATLKAENKLNLGVMGKIFAWWVVTIPFVFCTTAAVTMMLVNNID